MFARLRPLILGVSAMLLAAHFGGPAQGQQTGGGLVDPAWFKDPPAEFRGHPMFGFNLSNLSEAGIVSTVDDLAKKYGAGGITPEPGGGPTTGLSEAYLKATERPHSDQGVVYLSDEYFKYYRVALEEARKLGLEVVLYDEWRYPTGMVGGQLYTKYPQYAAKSLEMAEKDVTGPVTAELTVPQGIYVGAVMMNRDTFELTDISSRYAAGKPLSAPVPKGNWKVMAFYLNTAIVPTSVKGGVVDYLDPAAMDAFISLSYQKYYDHVGEFFGKQIKHSFWDEPAMHPIDGRMWTPSFNENFEKVYGYSPMKYYPALWYNIGPQTAAARNALWGFRARLFSENFVGKIEAFCEAHGIQAGGHWDQEEIVNPVPVNGDFIKLFEHEGVPGVDDIYYLGRSNPGYKIVTSAASNWDHPIVFAETYAAYGGVNEKTAYKVAMDQHAMGVNQQVTSGGPARTAYAPEFNKFLGRMGYLLQHGRHVADVAVLYPIASLQSVFKFDGGQASQSGGESRKANIDAVISAREGGITPPEIDYQDIGEVLFHGMRVDYTYLHPEVLVNKCTVENKRLVLNNRENREEYRVLFVPGGDTLSVAAAAKIKEFYDKGGVVIATHLLPTKSAEFGKDKEIQQMVADVFGLPVDDPPTADLQRAMNGRLISFYWVKRNAAGGQAYFLPQPEPWVLEWAVDRVLPVRDVNIQQPMPFLKKAPAYDGALTYLHKVKNGQDIYFFANSTDNPVDTKVVLRGRKDLKIWDPQTGEPRPADLTNGDASGQPVTTVHLVMPPVTALFYVGADR